jgi:CheY-like chemotaxis protein
VIEAIDGQAAVSRGLSSAPDIILMDVSLPVKDGYAATRELRAAGLTIPMVALTAYAMLYDREQALAAGCDAYETKPVDLRRLTKVLAELLQDRPRVTPATGLISESGSDVS